MCGVPTSQNTFFPVRCPPPLCSNGPLQHLALSWILSILRIWQAPACMKLHISFNWAQLVSPSVALPAEENKIDLIWFDLLELSKNKLNTAHRMLHPKCYILHATCWVLYASCYMLHLLVLIKVGALFTIEAPPQRSQMLFAPLPPRSDALPNIQG